MASNRSRAFFWYAAIKRGGDSRNDNLPLQIKRRAFLCAVQSKAFIYLFMYAAIR